MAQRENLTPADLARLTEEERRSVELAAAATEGPWEQLSGKYLAVDQGKSPQRFVALREADEQFICDARTAVPHFAAEVARLRGDSDKDAATMNAQANRIRALEQENERLHAFAKAERPNDYAPLEWWGKRANDTTVKLRECEREKKKLERVAEAAKALWVHEVGTTHWASVSQPLRAVGDKLLAAGLLDRE